MSIALTKVNLRDATTAWRYNFGNYRTKWRTEILASLIEPVVSFFALAFGVARLVGKLESGISYATFISAAVLSFNVMTVVFIELSYGAFNRLEWDEVYAKWMEGGVAAESAAFGDLLWGVTKSLVQGVFVFALIVVFRMTDSAMAPLAFIPLIIGSFLVGAAALAVTARIRNADNIKFLQSIFFSSVMFCGLWFPIDMFPKWLQTVLAPIPLTVIIKLVRETFTQQFSANVWLEIGYLVVLAVIAVELALRSVRRRFAIQK